MRTASVAVVATALIAMTTLSAAADQIITESFSVTIPNSPVPDGVQPFVQFNSTPFPLFDPATGLLKSVNVSLSGSVSVASLLADPNIALILRGGTPAIDSDILHVSGTSDIQLSGNDQNSFYMGTGDTQLLLLMGSGDNTPNASLISSDGPLNGVVIYTYALPTLAIPETPTWAAMLVGFAGLGIAGYRATRKAAAQA
jgi:hypothetical protein